MGTTRLWVEGVSLSVFILMATWGLVRSGLTGLAAMRYFQLRLERHPEAEGWPRPRLLGRTSLLIASIVCWPAIVVFVLALGFGIIASGAWYAVVAAWPVVAVALLVIDSRSPWAGFRAALAAAASAKVDQRDTALEKAFAEDPQLTGELLP